MDSSPIISLLTDDILAQILTRLSHDSDRKSFRLVCKSFLRIDSVHRRSLRVLRPEFLQSLVENFPQIESLDLSVCPPVDDGAVATAAGWGRGLRKLGLSRLTGLSPSGMEMLVRTCPCLEVVDVSYCCGFGDMMAVALSCAGGLRELRMDKCLGVSDVGLANIAVGCEKLERLSLKWCVEITDLGIDLLSKKSIHLKLLDISYLKVTNESLRSIANMEKLNELAMVGLKLVNDVGLHYLGEGCPALQAIDVSRCINVTSSGIMSIIQGHRGLLKLNAGYNFFEISTVVLGWFKDLKNLKTFRIDGTRISNSSLKIISTNCRFLVEIGLSKCKCVTDESILQLLSGCNNNDLKILDLTCCTALTDVAIAAISESCRNLLCLKLESCDLITDESLHFLGLRCSLLEELDLTDCSGVNDKGLNYLSKCSDLVCLKLGLCTNISDKGLSYIASKCTKIHELDLYRCTGIGDDGLAALSSGCKKLKKLNLSYCTEITDLGMKSLSLLAELTDLELRELANITGVGLSSLACGCKKLAELDLKHCQNITDSGFWDLAYYSKNLRQINLCNCAISDVGLCMVMGNLTCLQDAKLLNLENVSIKGFELGLRASCNTLKKTHHHLAVAAIAVALLGTKMLSRSVRKAAAASVAGSVTLPLIATLLHQKITVLLTANTKHLTQEDANIRRARIKRNEKVIIDINGKSIKLKSSSKLELGFVK